jgi:hypothetical protein
MTLDEILVDLEEKLDPELYEVRIVYHRALDHVAGSVEAADIHITCMGDFRFD